MQSTGPGPGEISSEERLQPPRSREVLLGGAGARTHTERCCGPDGETRDLFILSHLGGGGLQGAGMAPPEQPLCPGN